MTLYKALANFTFEEVVVVYNGSIIYQGEAWKFDVKEHWLSNVYSINIVYPKNDVDIVVITVVGNKNENDA